MPRNLIQEPAPQAVYTAPGTPPPIALSGELLHPLRGIEGGPLKRELVVLKLSVASVDGGNLERVKSVLIQERLGALLVVQERDNLFVNLRVQVGDEDSDATASPRSGRALLAEVDRPRPIRSRDEGQITDTA
jgi:hypothetical protein